MNNKRQTIWLVSMLGLMVVLSAYYLFTDEPKDTIITGEATNDSTVGEVVVEGVGFLDPASLQELNLDEIAPVTEHGEGDTAQADASGSANAGESKEGSISNEAALQQVMYQTAADTITNLQIDRNTFFSKELEELMMAMTDEAATEEIIAEAVNRQNELMDLEEKLIGFEEKMLSIYENAAVTYDKEADHFTVHLAAAELQKSEAASIVTQAINDLDIAVHQISVKLHKN